MQPVRLIGNLYDSVEVTRCNLYDNIGVAYHWNMYDSVGVAYNTNIVMSSLNHFQ